MITHYQHYDRYAELMAAVCGKSSRRADDGGYAAAIYILSADVDIYQIAKDYVTNEGINFDALTRKLRRMPHDDTQLVLVKSAHSLFNDGPMPPSPHMIANCDIYSRDIIVNALYIWSGQRRPVAGADGRMALDDAKEQEARKIYARLYSDLPELLGLDN